MIHFSHSEQCTGIRALQNIQAIPKYAGCPKIELAVPL